MHAAEPASAKPTVEILSNDSHCAACGEALAAAAHESKTRELENFVKRYLVLGDEPAAIAEVERDIAPQLTPPSAACVEPQGSDLKQMVKSLKNGAEIEAIANALEESGWNRKRATGILNISYKALLYKIRQYDIRPRQNR